MNPAIDALEHRIARLEKTNKILVGVFGASVVLLLLLLTGAASHGTQQARAFQLISETGEVRAELALQNGQPAFHLKDQDGVNRVSLFHETEASGLYVMDAEGVTRIGVAQFAHGGGGVALHGPESEGAAVLYLKKTGSLRFFNVNGEVTNEVLGVMPDQSGEKNAESPD